MAIKFRVPRNRAANDERKIDRRAEIMFRFAAARIRHAFFARDSAPPDLIKPVLLVDRTIRLRDEQRKSFFGGEIDNSPRFFAQI